MYACCALCLCHDPLCVHVGRRGFGLGTAFGNYYCRTEALDKSDSILVYLSSDLNLLGSVASMGDNASGNGVVKIRNMKLYAHNVAFFAGWNEFRHGHGEPGETGYEPLFRRVLQAIHTETPANAIGWLGQLIHVTQDTGCPPHAVSCNDARSCENWIDAAKIDIAPYKPQLFGETDDEALQGYLARIAKLQEYTRAVRPKRSCLWRHKETKRNVSP